MGLIKDIREIISEKRQQKELEFNFNELKLQIEEYKKCYFEEVKNFKGEHTHFAKAEIEDKILSKIEENEKILSVLTIDTKCNLGMLSAEVGLDNVVSKVLDNYEISLQQDSKGNNLGMYCANNKLEECVIKALDNKTASLQQNDDGENIGMLCAKNKLEKATFKVIENKEATVMKDYKGGSLAIYSAMNNLEECAIKVLDLYPECVYHTIMTDCEYQIGYFASINLQWNLMRKITEVKENNRKERIKERKKESKIEVENQNENTNFDDKLDYLSDESVDQELI